MTKSAGRRPTKAGGWSRLAAAGTAVGMSVGIANGMAFAANNETTSAPEPAPSVIRRVVVPEVQPIVVVIPRNTLDGPALDARPVAAATAQAPPAPEPAVLQTPAPQPVAESSGS